MLFFPLPLSTREVCRHVCSSHTLIVQMCGLQGIAQDLCFQIPVAFTVFFFFILSRHCERCAKRGEREKGAMSWARRPGELSPASACRQAEQQIAVASDGGRLARVSPRPPSISPLLAPALLLRGRRLSASGNYLNGKSKMAKCTFPHTYLEQFIPTNAFICLLLPA